jgi:hypothetical protein
MFWQLVARKTLGHERHLWREWIAAHLFPIDRR